MSNVKEENIIFLKVSSWIGSIGGEHYYGMAKIFEIRLGLCKR